MANKPTYSLQTFELINDAIEHRMQSITSELEAGFKMISSYPKSVTFFGSARIDETNPHYVQARALAKRIGIELGYAIVSGGGPGIMEAGNRGAAEAGVDSLGFTIKLPMEQITNPYVRTQSEFNYFFNRKVCMTFAAEAYIYFAGGFGTLDEFFEILTLVQTGKIERVPIILVGADFWHKILDPILETMLVEGTINELDMGLFVITDDDDAIIDMVRNAPIRTGIPTKATA